VIRYEKATAKELSIKREFETALNLTLYKEHDQAQPNKNEIDEILLQF